MDEVQTRIIDPVCGQELVEGEAEYVTHYHGRTYYFCGLQCQLDFQEKPENYVGPDA